MAVTFTSRVYFMNAVLLP